MTTSAAFGLRVLIDDTWPRGSIFLHSMAPPPVRVKYESNASYARRRREWWIKTHCWVTNLEPV